MILRDLGIMDAFRGEAKFKEQNEKQTKGLEDAKKENLEMKSKLEILMNDKEKNFKRMDYQLNRLTKMVGEVDSLVQTACTSLTSKIMNIVRRKL